MQTVVGAPLRSILLVMVAVFVPFMHGDSDKGVQPEADISRAQITEEAAGVASRHLLGQISGAVINEYGTPIDKARVWIDVAVSGNLDNSQFALTDENGRFEFRGLKLRRYIIAAEKEADGYPDPRLEIYRPAPTEVTLTKDTTSADLTLKVGPKAGVLTGRMRDKTSGKIIVGGFGLTRVDDPNVSVGMSGAAEFRLLLPPATDVILQATALGYKTWFYPGTPDRTHALPLHLESDEHKELDIEMEPEAALPPQN